MILSIGQISRMGRPGLWLLVAFLMLCWAPRALAHASLLASVPAAGSVLPTAPADVSLRFNEPVSPLVLRIVQPDGTAQDLTRVETVPGGLRVALPPLAEAGAYALSWRVVSADGHPVGGTVVFSVGHDPAHVGRASGGAATMDGAASGVHPGVGPGVGPGAGGTSAMSASAMSASAMSEAGHPGRSALVWLARLAAYAGLFLGVGLAVFQAWGRALSDPRRRRTGLVLLGLAALATVLNIGLLGVDALDAPLSALAGVEVWRVAGATSFGLSALLSLAAVVVATPVWWAGSKARGQWTAGASVALLAAALAASGHASVATPAWLARPSVALHAMAAVLWVGSLLPLAWVLDDGRNNAPDDTRRVLLRFSRAIPFVIALLAASGAMLVYLQFDTPASLWRTAYGQVLMAKLALLAGLLALAALNRYRLTEPVLRSEAAPRRIMRRVIGVELALALAILAVVALWRFTPPPRALESRPAEAETVSLRIRGAAATADLQWALAASGRPGELTLFLFHPDATPLQAQAVDVAFSNDAAGIEPIVFTAARSADGGWRIPGLTLPRQEAWHVRIEALVSDFERIRLQATLRRPE